MNVLNSSSEDATSADIFYSGVSDNPPSKILDDFTIQYFNSKEVSCQFTTKVLGQITGRHCCIAYPSAYGELQHVYCVYNNTELQIDMSDNWVRVPTLIRKNNKNYYLYYQKHTTKDDKVTYKFILQ